MPKNKKSQISRKIAYFFLTINTITWGAALILVKPAYVVTTPFRFLLYRYAIAVVLTLPLLIYYIKKIKNGELIHGVDCAKPKKIFSIIGLELLGTTLALSLLYAGLARTTAIEASLLTTTTPIFVVLAGIFFLKEKEEKHEWLGLGLAFLGTLLLTLFPLWKNHTQQASFSVWGNLLIIGQNIATAIYFILVKKHYQKIPKLFVTTISFYVGLVSFFLLSLWEATTQLPTNTRLLDYFITNLLTDWQHPSVWLASIYMAVFGSIIGLTAYIKGQEGVEASEASLFWYLQPLVYIPLGLLWLGESISLVQIGALGIILTGVMWAEKRG